MLVECVELHLAASLSGGHAGSLHGRDLHEVNRATVNVITNTCTFPDEKCQNGSCAKSPFAVEMMHSGITVPSSLSVYQEWSLKKKKH